MVTNNSDDDTNPALLALMTRYGVSLDVARFLTDTYTSGNSNKDNSSKDKETMELRLWDSYHKMAGIIITHDTNNQNSNAIKKEEIENNKEMASEELEALEAMFTSEEGFSFSSSTIDLQKRVRVIVPIPTGDNDDGAVDGGQAVKFFMEVSYIDGEYPSVRPRKCSPFSLVKLMFLFFEFYLFVPICC